MFINGKWITRKDFEIRNPYDNTIIGAIPLLSREETKHAIAIASKNKIFMKNLPINKRYKLLMGIANKLNSQKHAFAKIISMDVGKPIKQSLSEVDKTINEFELSAFYSKEMRGETIPIDNGIILNRKEPIGVVGAITPFNFPLSLISHKIGPAIAAGNCVVLHPSPKAPLAAVELTKLIEETLNELNIELGVFTLLTGKGEVVGDEISKNEKINMVSFTGSNIVGESIIKNAGIKKVSLELGGNNPMIVLKDSNIEKAAISAVFSKFLNSGQVCISVGVVFIEESKADEFIKYVLENVKKLIIGNPLEDKTNIGPLITKESVERVKTIIRESIESNGKLLFGGECEGNTIYPTVLEINSNNILSKIEVFGPVLPIVRVSNADEAIKYANNTEYGLQAGIYTNDINKAMELSMELEYGGVMINNSPTFRQDNMPFGGIKKSGLRREGTKYTIDEMTELKTIVIHNA